MRLPLALATALTLSSCLSPNERLVRATERGDADGVAAALKADGVDPNAQARDRHGFYEYPLATVVYGDGDRADIARLLLAAGADPNLRVDLDRSPVLSAAIEQQKWGIAQALLDQGADPQALDHWERTPLQVHLGGDERCELLKLPEAASLVDRLLPQGPLSDDARSHLDRALSAASRCRDAALVAKLQAAGAGFEATDRDGRTPLLNAAGGLDVGFLRRLLAAGAEVHATDAQGFDACTLANLNDMDRRGGRDWPARKRETVAALREAGLECEVWSREQVAAFNQDRFERARLAEARAKARRRPAPSPASWEAIQRERAEAEAKAEAAAAAAARAEQESAWYNVRVDTSTYDNARKCPDGGTYCGNTCCGTGLVCCVPDGATDRQGGVCKAIQAGRGCGWGTHPVR